MTGSFFSGTEGIDPEVVDAARAELAAKLPELRELPGFPIGTDEDILRMSVPPYYTACPNPFMAQWLEESAPEGYEDREYVDPGPFASDVTASKTHPSYKAHKYWTKVPHELIMRYLLHYTMPGDVVVDGFAGSGMTGVAAQACSSPEPSLRAGIESELGDVEWGARRSVLQDLAPVASFISAGLNLPIDADEFDLASRKVLDDFEEAWAWMYETTHTDGSLARIDYTVWSEILSCPICGGEILFFDEAFIPATGRVSDDLTCSNCGAALRKRQLQHRLSNQRTIGGDTANQIRFEPVLIRYKAAGAVYEKRPEAADLATIERASTASPPWFPSVELPYMHRTHERDAVIARGIQSTHHFFSARSLVSLAALWETASTHVNPLTRLALLFWVEQAIWGLSWMNRYAPTSFSQVNRNLAGVYYVSSLSSECSPWYNLEGSSPPRGKRISLRKMWNGGPRDGVQR